MALTKSPYPPDNQYSAVDTHPDSMGALWPYGGPPSAQNLPGVLGARDFFQYFFMNTLHQPQMEVGTAKYLSVWLTTLSDLERESLLGNHWWVDAIRHRTHSDYPFLISAVVRFQEEDLCPWFGTSSSESGTDVEEYANRLAGVLDAARWALNVADVEDFDGWMESPNSRVLDLLIHDYPDVAFEAMRQVLASSTVNTDAAVKSLRQIGRIEDRLNHKERLMFLTGQLKASDPRIRDAASAAIAGIGGTQAIQSLQAAVDAEPLNWVKRNLELALQQLKAWNSGAVSKNPR